MPNEKRFEVLTSSFERKQIDMFELAEHYYFHVKRAAEIIAAGGVASFEVGNEVTENDELKLYRIKKTSQDEFTLKLLPDNTTRTLTPIELLNFLFEKAPFIPMVGEERGGF